jgi:hypothetical protein
MAMCVTIRVRGMNAAANPVCSAFLTRHMRYLGSF